MRGETIRLRLQVRFIVRRSRHIHYQSCLLLSLYHHLDLWGGFLRVEIYAFLWPTPPSPLRPENRTVDIVVCLFIPNLLLLMYILL